MADWSGYAEARDALGKLLKIIDAHQDELADLSNQVRNGDSVAMQAVDSISAAVEELHGATLKTASMLNRLARMPRISAGD